MTFKGTNRIGSVNFKKEELLLDSLDEGGYKHDKALTIMFVASPIQNVLFRALDRRFICDHQHHAEPLKSAASV